MALPQLLELSQLFNQNCTLLNRAYSKGAVAFFCRETRDPLKGKALGPLGLKLKCCELCIYCSITAYK